MRDEAYILREWWAYLDSIHRRWDQVNDQVLIDWRERMKRERQTLIGEGKGEKAMKEQRINRKLAVVFLFYDKAKDCNLLPSDLVSTAGPLTCRSKEDKSAHSKLSMADPVGSPSVEDRLSRMGLRRFSLLVPPSPDAPPLTT